jgi:type I restriction enzyme S subunit
VSSGEVANCRIAFTRETVSELGLANSSAKVYPSGTVLIAMIGEGKTRGQAAILDIEASTNQNAAGVLADRRFVDPEYLWRWALAEYETTRAAGTGGNQPALNKQRVANLIIPVPPLEEQAEVVRRVDQLLAVAGRLLARIDLAARRVDRSSQAVLAKAFRGELTLTTQEAAGESRN